MVQALLRRPNLLAYPGGTPGFDPSHVAAAGVTLSAVSVGANMVDLLTGKSGVRTSTPTAAIDGIGGVGTTFAGAQNLAFSGKPTGNFFTQCTIAAIFLDGGSAATQRGVVAAATNGSSTTYPYLGTSAANHTYGYARQGTAQIVTALTVMPSNIPHLLIGSDVGGTGGARAILIKNLLTGQIWTATDTGGTTVVGVDGAYNIGSRGAGSLPLLTGDKVFAAMVSNRFTTMAQMLQWAQDPWAFWYPKFDFAQSLATASGGGAVSGTLATTDTTDIAAFLGTVDIQGILSAIENPDVASFLGNFITSGTLSVTELSDIAAFFGSPSISGTLAATEAADILSFIEAAAGGGRWFKDPFRPTERRVTHSDAVNKAAAVLSKMGGIARAQALTANQRSNIASKAAQARWTRK